MRLRFGVCCTAVTCASAAIAGVASCVSDPESPPAPAPTARDASLTDGPIAPRTDAPPGTMDAQPGTIDAGPGDAAAGGCVPANMDAFQPPPYVRATDQVLVCPRHEGKWLAQKCFGDAATFAECASFATTGSPDGGPIDTDCVKCLITPESTDAGYGPAINGAVLSPNVAGCIELADPSDAGVACAHAVHAAWACADRACRPSCPVSDDTSWRAYAACTQAAATSVCSSFTRTAEACTASEIDSGFRVGNFCFQGTDPVERFDLLSAFFCTS